MRVVIVNFWRLNISLKEGGFTIKISLLVIKMPSYPMVWLMLTLRQFIDFSSTLNL